MICFAESRYIVTKIWAESMSENLLIRVELGTGGGRVVKFSACKTISLGFKRRLGISCFQVAVWLEKNLAQTNIELDYKLEPKPMYI